jgi:hypothetical protein
MPRNTIKAGDVIHTGQGPEETRALIKRRLQRVVQVSGEDIVARALNAHDETAWEFMAWFSGLEARAAAESADPDIGGRGNNAGDGPGVPLGPAARQAYAVSALLSQLMEHPDEVLEALDKGRSVW